MRFFKVSEAQQKVYADMRSQLENLETDLEQSKLTRERLQQEYEKQLEELNEKHNEDVSFVRETV